MTALSSQTYRSKFIYFLILTSTLALVGTQSSTPINEQEIATLKRTIQTNIKLTKIFAVSPMSDHFVVAGQNGQVKVFNYESAQTIQAWVEKEYNIVSILWENYHEGLVTILTNTTSNSSVVIQHDSVNFEQTYRWQFTQLIHNADSIKNKYESFIAFNFLTHVDEYHLKTHKKSTTYKPASGQQFMQMSYSSQYTYLYLSGNGNQIYAFKCGTIYRFYEATSGIVTRFEADRYNNQHSPVIYKKQGAGYEVMDPNYQFNATFPQQKINFFKFCPKDYILGVDVDQRIIIYSRDYKFTKKQVILTFLNQSQILSISCQNSRIIVSASDNKVYVFELKTSEKTQSQGWIYVVGIGGGVTLLLILVSIYAVVKLKKRRQNMRIESPSLLTSEPKSSFVSEILN